METIDFVIAWVDGGDPAWQAEKARYRSGDGGDNRNLRYRDWDTLRYWFRAVEKYAPWVNRIHLLTWGHVPAWLNTEHPKVNVVKHTDFIPGEYLPTFSSHPIELNLHRIPGLGEQFVYFNDDFFLTAPVKPRDFFRKGLPCDSLEESPLDLSWSNLMVGVNTNDVIYTNRHFSKKECRRQNLSKWYPVTTPVIAMKNLLLTGVRPGSFFGMNNHHLPQSYLKRTLEETWQQDDGWLHTTCTHKFRTEKDVSQVVFKFRQLAKGDFVPYNKRKYGRWYPGGHPLEHACDSIRKRRYKYICFNDGDNLDFDTAKKALHEAFESVLPERSGFEKTEESL